MITPYYDDGVVTIYHGDCVEVLASLSLSAAVTVTSPPYWNARAYGGLFWPTYDAYLAWVSRVLEQLATRTGWLAWIAGYIWKDGAMYDCSGDAARLAVGHGFTWRQQVPWVKSDYAPQPSIDLAPAHELIQLLRSSATAVAQFDLLRVDRRAAARLGKIAEERPAAGAQRGGGDWVGT